MANKIWFIREGDIPLAAYSGQEEAEDELEYLTEQLDGEYELYSIPLNLLEEYPEEYDLAQEADLV
jgi:hypothetical protein